MDDSVPFSVLNERLRPRFTAMERLCYSLNTLEARSTGSLRSSSLTARPTILSTKPEPEGPVTREARSTGSLRGSTLTVRPTILSTKPEPQDPVTTAEPEEPEYYSEEDDLVDDGLPEEEENSSDLLPIINQCLVPTLNVEDVDSVGQENNSPSLTEESDSPDTTAGTGEGPEPAALTSDGSLSQSYLDGTLPDLIRSGRPLSRRRTLGPVSDTLKEVRREVELSRRRSLKLKAQVDQLQSRDGPGWSQHRERVTEEVLSILRLLHPLTEPESGFAEPSAQGNCLDAALSQLQNVARTLAISHTKQESKAAKGNGEEDSAVLQQALWDRDEAIEKKKAMEAELLRSKTEMMLLNNQLLEAVQKRLELSLELEAWKDDVQLILHQQLQSQQQAEQAQRKPSRMGLLRRNNRPPIQKPTSFPLPAPTAPSTNSNHIFISRTSLTFPPHNTPTPTPAPAPVASAPPAGTQRNWRDRLKMGKNSRQGDQDAAGQGSSSQGWGKDKDGFQVVSLD